MASFGRVGLGVPLVLLVLLAAVPARGEIPGPVQTRSARAGELDLRVVAGASVTLGERRLFFEHSRDRFELPHLQVEFSFLRRVAIELDYALWWVHFHRESSEKEPLEDGYGSGDLRVRSRFAVLMEHLWRPALAVQLGVKLPNAPSREGFGTDEIDLEAGILLSKLLGPVDLHLSVALGILGDPTRRAAQDDVLLASGLLVLRPAPPLRLLVEVWTMAPSSLNSGRAVLRGGAGLRVRGIDLGVTAGVGLSPDSPWFVAGFDVGFDGPLRRPTNP
jgi:hypothetical protein